MSMLIQILSANLGGQTRRHGRCTTASVPKRSSHTLDRGFTLIELMMVVAIIGILASLAIYMFGGQQKKMNAKTEVTGMFTEFKLRQEQYRTENGSYLGSNTANDETGYPTAAPKGDGGKTGLFTGADPAPANWTALRMQPDAAAVYCSYVSVVGTKDDDPVGVLATGVFNYVPPDVDWYYIVAHCDMDMDSTVDSYYLQHSESSELYFQDQGR